MRIVISVLLCSLFSCGNQELLEKEPNNQFRLANRIKINSSVTGHFNHNQDNDFYRFELTKKTLLIIKVSRIKGYDLQLKIYRDKELIKVIDDYQKNEGEKIDNLLLEQGIYYLVVAPGRFNSLFLKEKVQLSDFPTQNYKLIIQSQVEKYQEIEPNDIPKQAVSLEIGKTIKGFFSPFNSINQGLKLKKPPFNDPELTKFKKYDFDWYSFSIPKIGTHNITVTLDKVNNVNSILAVYQNRRLILIDSKGFSGGEQIPNLTVEGQKVYFILVIGIPSDYATSSNKIYSYNLTLNLLSDSILVTETGNNNSFKEADPMIDGVIHGILSPKEDLDYYRIALKDSNQELSTSNSPHKIVQNRKRLSVSLTGVSNIDLELRLYNSKEKLLNVYDNNQVGEGEVIKSFDVTNMKMIYLLVKGGKENKVDNVNDSYKLTATVNNHIWNTELEPNHLHPNPLFMNQKLIGFINPKAYRDKNIKRRGDIDLYEVRLKEGKKYKLIVTGIKGIHLKVSIFHSIDYRSPFKELEILGRKKESRSIRFESFVAPLNPDANIYRIKVQSQFGRMSNSNIPYTLLIREH